MTPTDIAYGPGTGGAYTTEKQRARRQRPNHATHVITARQRQILRGILRGLTMREVGAELGIARKTVAAQLALVRELLGIQSSLEAARLMDAAGLLAEPGDDA